MAVDTTEIAKNLCTRLMAAAESIMGGIEMIDRVSDQVTSSGLDLTAPAVQAALSAPASPLKHADGAAFLAVITSGNAIKAWMEANFHDDNLQKVRNGVQSRIGIV